MQPKTLAGLILVCFLAACVRFGLISYQKCIETDGFWYIQTAQRLLAGKSVASVFPPGYPLLILPARRFVPDWELAARITTAVFGVLMIPPLFLLARHIFGERTGWCTVVLASIYPSLVEHSTQAMSEIPYTFFFAAAALCAYRGWRFQRPSRWALSGGLFGYAFLIRPEALMYLPLGLILSLWPSRGRKTSFGRRARGALLFCSLLLVIPFPYWLHLRIVRGEWRLTMKRTCALSYSMVTGARHVSLARDKLFKELHYKLPTLTQAFLKQPKVMIQAFVINVHATHKHVIPALLPPLALAMLVLGMTYPRRGREPSAAGELFLAGLGLAYVPVFFFEVGPRVFLPLVALWLPWAGRGIVVAGQWIRTALNKFRLPIGDRGATVCAAVVVGMGLLPFTLRPLYRPDERAIFREAGTWMKEHLQPPLRIAHRKPWIAFYAQGEYVQPPLGSYKEIIKFCRLADVTHLVVDSKIMFELRPSLRFLLYNNHPPKELTFVKAFEDEQHLRVAIYRLNAAGRGPAPSPRRASNPPGGRKRE